MGTFLWLILEIGAFAVVSIRDGVLFSWEQHREAREKIMGDYQSALVKEEKYNKKSLETKKRIRRPEEVIHPYLGYVVDHQDTRCPDFGFCDYRNRGKTTTEVFDKKSDQVYVGIFGGSFAYGVSVTSTPGLIEKVIAGIPKYAGKEIIVYTISAGGFKQPQQLMALNYYLIQGIEFDLIINIDGFNDIVLPIVDGLNRGTNPLFPRGWAARFRGAYNKEQLILNGTIELLRKDRYDMAKSLDNSLMRFSVIANSIWLQRDARRITKIADIQNFLVTQDTRKKFKASYAATGPAYSFDSQDELYKDLADTWALGSRMIYDLSKSNSFEYFHFLQPNQYVKGSKLFSEDERKIAILEGYAYQKPAVEGYPYLINAGKKLQQNGVPFYDLTRMFEDKEEILYVDACCHLNQQGYDYVVQEIAKIIQQN